MAKALFLPMLCKLRVEFSAEKREQATSNEKGGTGAAAAVAERRGNRAAARVE